MPIKTTFVTEQHIRNTALPTHGKTYTVIPHGYVIDQAKQELASAGLEITRSLYKCSLDGQIAQGIYHLNSAADKDMGMMFAWSNSYNKMMKFKCAIGAQVFICMNGVVSGDLGTYKRKHTGTALADVTSSIQFQIANATHYYNNLIADKEMLKQVILSKRDQSSIIGQLYADKEILTLTQLAQVKREMGTPSHVYNADVNSAWSLYNHITLALKESHPLTFLNDHQEVHTFFVNEFGQLQSYAMPDIDPDDSDESEQESDFELAESTEDSFGVTFM